MACQVSSGAKQRIQIQLVALAVSNAYFVLERAGQVCKNPCKARLLFKVASMLAGDIRRASAAQGI
jgi:hypothetical protein